ncbi:hypothetical protein CWI36_1606p0010 [Hamiltosporidium magnivora]|uniref:Uncharacterized protein n=1 Tax=Hamiltosporidium magnivora TaxID=148818 RepID=A0A4Q9L236_9MICR|nr:hypothetical protein CWI36_1606p0010 [Hamiltosporidium magnivora]
MVETKKLRKYDLLANELGLIYKCGVERASMGVIMRAEMHEEPTPPLKEAKREEGEEPTNNINKESDLEEETAVVKELEENIKKW